RRFHWRVPVCFRGLVLRSVREPCQMVLLGHNGFRHCLSVAAIGIGALRQLYNGLRERAVAVRTNRGPIYLGIVPPKFWFDVRAHGASWLLVGALSVWASWGLACGVFRSHSREEFLL